MSQPVHDAAQRGYTLAPDSYQRGRPGYPPAVRDWLVATLGMHHAAQVVDLGAGTGKFTSLLAAMGVQVTAIEPVDAMRQKLSHSLPAVRALAGRAEAIPLPDAQADVMVCAQSFHWFANAQALHEMHRVLKPGGRLGLVWNVRDEACDWVAAITEIITPYEGDAPRYYTGQWKRPFEGQALFAPLQLTEFRQHHEGPFEQVVIDRLMSVSFIAALPAAEREAVAAKLRTLRQRFAVLREPLVSLPYVTQAWHAARLS